MEYLHNLPLQELNHDIDQSESKIEAIQKTLAMQQDILKVFDKIFKNIFLKFTIFLGFTNQLQ